MSEDLQESIGQAAVILSLGVAALCILAGLSKCESSEADRNYKDALIQQMKGTKP